MGSEMCIRDRKKKRRGRKRGRRVPKGGIIWEEELGEKKEWDLDAEIRETEDLKPAMEEEEGPGLEMREIGRKRTLEDVLEDKIDEEIMLARQILELEPGCEEGAQVRFRLADLYWEKSKRAFFKSQDFNTPEKEVYWKDRTLEFFHEYATTTLGVPEEDIIYKEGWWEGGGNAGPDVEPIVSGLEIATLVFMEYQVRDGVYEKMPTRVVDTGYGLERITWLSQGTPTAFDAVYGCLADRFLDALGVDRPDRDLMERYSTLSSLTAHVERGKTVSYTHLTLPTN